MNQAFPTSADLRTSTSSQPPRGLHGCGCNCAPSDDHKHQFAYCIVAQKVFQLISSISNTPVNTFLSHLWTLHPPTGMHGGIWQTTALAALHAMHSGHQHMYKLRLQHHHPSPGLALQGSVHSIKTFWESLTHFALRNGPAQWSDTPPNGPIFGRIASPAWPQWKVLTPPPLAQ